MNKPICGDWDLMLSKNEQPRALNHDCQNPATRISYIYEGLSVYVCDAPFEGDHEWAAPFTDDGIEKLT